MSFGNTFWVGDRVAVTRKFNGVEVGRFFGLVKAVTWTDGSGSYPVAYFENDSLPVDVVNGRCVVPGYSQIYGYETIVRVTRRANK